MKKPFIHLKKLQFGLLVLSSCLIILASCKKENISTKNETFTIQYKDKKLFFKSSNDLYHYLNRLSVLNHSEKINELKKLKIKTLDVVYDDVSRAEEYHQEKFYKGKNPNLSLSEYEKKGLFYEHTDLFNQYICKGIIKKVKDNDSWSYNLSVENPGYTPVLNELGEVLVADTLYKFEGSKLTLKRYSDDSLIVSLDFDLIQKYGSNWTTQLNSGNWIYDGSNKRYKATIYGSAITSELDTPGGIVISNFYVSAEAEDKKWGSWGKRSSYMPIYSFSISWSYTYTAKSCWNCSDMINPYSLGGSGNQSPFSWSSTTDPNGQTNYFVRYFNPNGTYTLPSPWLISSPLNVTYSSVISFSGGSSGYTYSMIH